MVIRKTRSNNNEDILYNLRPEEWWSRNLIPHVDQLGTVTGKCRYCQPEGN
jgi:hypothetical protein